MTEIGHCVISMLEYSENVTIVWHMKSPMLQLVTIPKPFEFLPTKLKVKLTLF